MCPFLNIILFTCAHPWVLRFALTMVKMNKWSRSFDSRCLGPSSLDARWTSFLPHSPLYSHPSPRRHHPDNPRKSCVCFIDATSALGSFLRRCCTHICGSLDPHASDLENLAASQRTRNNRLPPPSIPPSPPPRLLPLSSAHDTQEMRLA